MSVAVRCGQITCAGDKPVCCATSYGNTCIDQEGSCSGMRFACDESADCASGQVCCAREAALCGSRADCTANDGVELCTSDTECPAGQRCIAYVVATGARACVFPP